MHPQDTKCTPQPEQESIFRTVFAGRVRFGGVFRRSLRASQLPKELRLSADHEDFLSLSSDLTCQFVISFIITVTNGHHPLLLLSSTIQRNARHLQSVHDGVQVSARFSAAVPCRTLRTCRGCTRSSSSPLCFSWSSGLPSLQLVKLWPTCSG